MPNQAYINEPSRDKTKAKVKEIAFDLIKLYAQRKAQKGFAHAPDNYMQTELEASVFKRLVNHLQQHSDVQNIELMILADFCRNCLAKWYTAAAIERGIEMDYEQAREMVYGMPYNEWKDKFQKEATQEQVAAYNQTQQVKLD